MSFLNLDQVIKLEQDRAIVKPTS
ncbi:MAG: hypothetical protein FD136_1169, partial [Chitinophagaceae bacterium]